MIGIIEPHQNYILGVLRRGLLHNLLVHLPRLIGGVSLLISTRMVLVSSLGTMAQTVVTCAI